MNAYSESYLSDAMKNLGDMVDFAVRQLEYDADEFWDYFIASGIASRFEKGNPRFVAGMSGYELTDAVIYATKEARVDTKPEYVDYKSREYWAGWVLAYYQWQTNLRFEEMVQDGLTLSRVLSMYILHEADISKFVECANEIILASKAKRKSNLHTIRKARGFTQQELSKHSGVSLRMIQLYEQRQNDISKAQVSVVMNLAQSLGCDVKDLLE